MFSKEKEYVSFQAGCECIGHVRCDFEVFYTKGLILGPFPKVELDKQDSLVHVRNQALFGSVLGDCCLPSTGHLALASCRGQ